MGQGTEVETTNPGERGNVEGPRKRLPRGLIALIALIALLAISAIVGASMVKEHVLP